MKTFASTLVLAAFLCTALPGNEAAAAAQSEWSATPASAYAFGSGLAKAGRDDRGGDDSGSEDRRGTDDPPGDDRGSGGNGADDPPGDDRGSGGNGADDPPGDDRGSGGNGADDPPGDDRGSGRNGADDPAGDDRGGAGSNRRTEVRATLGQAQQAATIDSAIAAAQALITGGSVVEIELKLAGAVPYFEVKVATPAGAVAEICLNGTTLGITQCPRASQQTLAAIPLPAALAAARALVAGTVVAIEMDRTGAGLLVYRIEILLASGEDVKVLVDAQTGVATLSQKK